MLPTPSASSRLTPPAPQARVSRSSRPRHRGPAPSPAAAGGSQALGPGSGSSGAEGAVEPASPGTGWLARAGLGQAPGLVGEGPGLERANAPRAAERARES